MIAVDRVVLRWALGAAFVLGLAIGAARAETVTVTVGASHKMRALLILPDQPAPRPGILVLHTSGGLHGADTDFAQALAHEGYVALVPAFMEPYGITARTRRETFTGAGSMTISSPRSTCCGITPGSLARP